MTLLALLLLAAPVWAGELPNTSGSLRVQVVAKPQSGVDTSQCYLKGEPVPCVGHAYDRRVGSVAEVPTEVEIKGSYPLHTIENCQMWIDTDNGLRMEGSGCRPYLQKPGCYRHGRWGD